MVKKLKFFTIFSIGIFCFLQSGFAFDVSELSKCDRIVAKTITATDSQHKAKSARTEIEGTKNLIYFFGETKQEFDTKYIYLNDSGAIESDGIATWYQFGKKRNRYNLYYQKNDATSETKGGDTLVLCKKSRDLIFVVAMQKSKNESKLLELLSVKKPELQKEIKEQKDIEPVINLSDKNWIQIYFTPSKDCENNIIQRIEKAKKLDIAVYAITNRAIVDSILEAKTRGAKIRIITDRLQAAGKGSLVSELESTGLPVRTNIKHKIEHNKFAVFDDKEIVSGSYNWTDAASNKNSENCLFFRQPDTKAFSKRFQYLWDFYGD